MVYRMMADAVVVVHLIFVLYAIFGGLLVLRWRSTAFLHVPALLWGIVVEAQGWICPLTPLENRLRMAAGDAGYRGGFVENYLLPVLYPENLTRPDQVMLAIGLAAVNIVVYSIVIRKVLRSRKG